MLLFKDCDTIHGIATFRINPGNDIARVVKQVKALMNTMPFTLSCIFTGAVRKMFFKNTELIVDVFR